MELMIAYDHIRDYDFALDKVKDLFAESKPNILLVTVVEGPGTTTDATDEMFCREYREQKEGADRAASELTAAGFPTRVLFAEGDARKMILRAAEERKPDVLVVTRERYNPQGGLIGRSIDALVEEFDHMTFGSVSAFLARRAKCPLLILTPPE